MDGHHTRLRYDVETKEFRAQYSDPVDPFLDSAKRARDLEEFQGTAGHGDHGYKRLCTLPMTEVLRIKDKYGIDMTNLRDKTERKRALRIVEQEYPHLKTTNQRIG